MDSIPLRGFNYVQAGMYLGQYAVIVKSSGEPLDFLPTNCGVQTVERILAQWDDFFTSQSHLA